MADLDLVNAQKLLETAAAAANISKTQAKTNADTAKKPKLIPKANAKKWLDRIRRSEKLYKPFREDAERYRRMYQGDYSERQGKRGKYQEMSVNIIYSHIEIITPAVFSGFPFIRVRPKYKPGMDRTQADMTAEHVQAVIHYWFKELATDTELADILFDSFFGHAGAELGWETEILEKTEPAEGEYDSNEEVPAAAPLIVAKDQPFIKRVDPDDIRFDSDARRRRDSMWIAKREVIKYNYFIESDKFTEKAKKKVKPQAYPESEADKDYGRAEREEDRSDREWVEIWTVWDRENFRKYVITKGVECFLNTDDPQGEEWPLEIEYKDDVFPFAIHDAKRDRKCPYTWSEFRAYEAQIMELNRIRSAIQIHVKRTLPKYVYMAAAGDRHKISKLMNARSDEAVQLDNIEAIRPFENAQVPKDLYDFNQMAKDDLLNVSGLFEFQNQSIADTATEASLIEGRSQVRKSMRTKQWEQFVCEIASKLMQLCQQFMSTPVAVEIAGPNGVEWMNVTKDQIQGEFELDIEPGIMEYKNEALRKQQLLKFVEITANDVNVNRRKLISKVAQEFDISPEDVMVSEEEVAQAMKPPEPSIQFKDIDTESITDPIMQGAILQAAMAQNGVQPPQMPQQQPGMPPDMGMPASSGKDISGMGAIPNGNAGGEPVIGNLMEATPMGPM